MCRNYDAGECVEPGCAGRITCHDFNDQRCAEHSINGRNNLFTEDDEPIRQVYDSDGDPTIWIDR